MLQNYKTTAKINVRHGEGERESGGGCSASLASKKKLIIWQYTEKFKGGKAVSNHTFPISIARITYLGTGVTSQHSPYYQQQKPCNICSNNNT